MVRNDESSVRSPQGKEIIAYAMNSEYCVLEFTEMDDGSMTVADVTDHLRQLEEMHANNDPAEPVDADK